MQLNMAIFASLIDGSYCLLFSLHPCMLALKISISAEVWQLLLMDAKIYWDPFNGFFVIYCFRCFHPLPILRIRLIKLIRIVPGFNRNLTVPNNTVSYLILVELVLCWYSWIVTTRYILQFRLYFCWCNIFPSPVKGSLIWVVYLWEGDPQAQCGTYAGTLHMPEWTIPVSEQ